MPLAIEELLVLKLTIRSLLQLPLLIRIDEQKLWIEDLNLRIGDKKLPTEE